MALMVNYWACLVYLRQNNNLIMAAFTKKNHLFFSNENFKRKHKIIVITSPK